MCSSARSLLVCLLVLFIYSGVVVNSVVAAESSRLVVDASAAEVPDFLHTSALLASSASSSSACRDEPSASDSTRVEAPSTFSRVTDTLLGQTVFQVNLSRLATSTSAAAATACPTARTIRVSKETVTSLPESLRFEHEESAHFRWRFRLSGDFFPTPSASRLQLHTLEAANGDSLLPLFSLELHHNRSTTHPELTLRWSNGRGSGRGQSGMPESQVLHLASAVEFLDTWVEASEQIHFSHKGSYSLYLNRVADNAALLSFSLPNVDSWRAFGTSHVKPSWNAHFVGPAPQASADLNVRYASFCFAKSPEVCEENIFSPLMGFVAGVSHPANTPVKPQPVKCVLPVFVGATQLFSFGAFVPFFLPLGAVGVIRWGNFMLKALSAIVAVIRSRWCPRYSKLGKYRPKDCCIIVPTIDAGPELSDALTSWLRNFPAKIIFVTVTGEAQNITNLVRGIEMKWRETLPEDKKLDVEVIISVVKLPNKRYQMVEGLKLVDTDLVIFADDDAIWPDPLLEEMCKVFEDPAIGGIGTEQRMRPNDPSGSGVMWEVFADFRLTAKTMENCCSITLGNAVTCLSGRTAGYRTCIFKPTPKEGPGNPKANSMFGFREDGFHKNHFKNRKPKPVPMTEVKIERWKTKRSDSATTLPALPSSTSAESLGSDAAAAAPSNSSSGGDQALTSAPSSTDNSAPTTHENTPAASAAPSPNGPKAEGAPVAAATGSEMPSHWLNPRAEDCRTEETEENKRDEATKRDEAAATAAGPSIAVVPQDVANQITGKGIAVVPNTNYNSKGKKYEADQELCDDLFEEFSHSFLNDFWCGKYHLHSGDDKFLTRWIITRGWRMYTLIGPKTCIWSTFKPNWIFLKQYLRWTRNTWRSDFRSIFIDRCVWMSPRDYWVLIFIMMDKIFSPLTLLAGPLFLILLVTYSAIGCPNGLGENHLSTWNIVLSYAIWLPVARAARIFPHFLTRPRHIIYVPAFVALQYVLAILKIYCLFTLHVTAWGTRNMGDDGVDGEDNPALVANVPAPVDPIKEMLDEERRLKTERERLIAACSAEKVLEAQRAAEAINLDEEEEQGAFVSSWPPPPLGENQCPSPSQHTVTIFSRSPSPDSEIEFAEVSSNFGSDDDNRSTPSQKIIDHPVPVDAQAAPGAVGAALPIDAALSAASSSLPALPRPVSVDAPVSAAAAGVAVAEDEKHSEDEEQEEGSEMGSPSEPQGRAITLHTMGRTASSLTHDRLRYYSKREAALRAEGVQLQEVDYDAEMAPVNHALKSTVKKWQKYMDLPARATPVPQLTDEAALRAYSPRARDLKRPDSPSVRSINTSVNSSMYSRSPVSFREHVGSDDDDIKTTSESDCRDDDEDPSSSPDPEVCAARLNENIAKRKPTKRAALMKSNWSDYVVTPMPLRMQVNSMAMLHNEQEPLKHMLGVKSNTKKSFEAVPADQDFPVSKEYEMDDEDVTPQASPVFEQRKGAETPISRAPPNSPESHMPARGLNLAAVAVAAAPHAQLEAVQEQEQQPIPAAAAAELKPEEQAAQKEQQQQQQPVPHPESAAAVAVVAEEAVQVPLKPEQMAAVVVPHPESLIAVVVPEGDELNKPLPVSTDAAAVSKEDAAKLNFEGTGFVKSEHPMMSMSHLTAQEVSVALAHLTPRRVHPESRKSMMLTKKQREEGDESLTPREPLSAHEQQQQQLQETYQSDEKQEQEQQPHDTVRETHPESQPQQDEGQRVKAPILLASGLPAAEPISTASPSEPEQEQGEPDPVVSRPVHPENTTAAFDKVHSSPSRISRAASISEEEIEDADVSDLP